MSPVPVDIAANAGSSWGCLAVLPPQAVAALCKSETIGVDDGENVEVVLVLEGSSGSVGRCQ